MGLLNTKLYAFDVYTFIIGTREWYICTVVDDYHIIINILINDKYINNDMLSYHIIIYNEWPMGNISSTRLRPSMFMLFSN